MVDTPTDVFPRRYIFHGNAVAAEVFLTKIANVAQNPPVINLVTGPSTLPVIGGISESVVPTPSILKPLAGVFSYGASRTSAEGIIVNGTPVTTVAAAVQNVRVTNRPAPGPSSNPAPLVFEATALSLTLRSTHPSQDQPSIVFAEPPLFQGLSLAGQPISLTLNDDLMGLGRWDDLESRFRTDRAFFDGCSFGSVNGGPAAFGQGIPFQRGSFALCSFVRSINWGGREIPGHVLALPDFGAIYFGEILLNDRERRVTMVRMQLGCENAGQAVFAETDPNGTWWPPRKI
ncbi:MAG TPA: hypothetical protein VMR62_32365 [Bryobacteraceae bacterium]|nr:hypothetical protein [Bryobacteraceae bacterium]